MGGPAARHVRGVPKDLSIVTNVTLSRRRLTESGNMTGAFLGSDGSSITSGSASYRQASAPKYELSHFSHAFQCKGLLPLQDPEAPQRPVDHKTGKPKGSSDMFENKIDHCRIYLSGVCAQLFIWCLYATKFCLAFLQAIMFSMGNNRR